MKVFQKPKQWLDKYYKTYHNFPKSRYITEEINAIKRATVLFLEKILINALFIFIILFFFTFYTYGTYDFYLLRMNVLQAIGYSLAWYLLLIVLDSIIQVLKKPYEPRREE